MNQALERERILFNLWARKPISASDDYTQKVLDDLLSKGRISGEGEDISLTGEGLQYVLHERDPQDLVELLGDIEMRQEERIFLANAAREIVDKPFAYQIIKESRENPDRETYPSVDFGAYEDIKHGLLFGARTHIMIDPRIKQQNLVTIIGKLDEFGARVKRITTNVTNNHDNGYRANIRYRVGDVERELYLVGTEAMKAEGYIEQMFGADIFSLMMKSRGRVKGDSTSHLPEEVKYFGNFIREGGLLLGAVSPKPDFKEIGKGMLAYWSHTHQEHRFSQHGLYQKAPKG